MHLAHLNIAKACADALNLKEVRWIVTGQPEHKGIHAKASDRFEMVRLALAEINDPRMIADDHEIRAASTGRSNFTADTITELQKEHPQQRMVLIIGEDQLESFQAWSRWQWIAQQVDLAVCKRPGVASEAASKAIANAGGTIRWVETPPSTLASTSVRQRIRDGAPTSGLIPDSVAHYIQTHSLYRANP